MADIPKDPPLRFAVCLCNDGWPSSLRLRKLYQVLPAQPNEREKGWIRIVDESAEDYLFPETYFHPVELPEEVAAALLVAAEGEEWDWGPG